MELYIRKIYNSDVLKLFGYFGQTSDKNRFRSLKRKRTYMVESNNERIRGVYYKLVNNYSYPLWINARGAAKDQSGILKLSTVYYFYVKDNGIIIDFLGVCFRTPTFDYVFSIKYNRLKKYFKFLEFGQLLDNIQFYESKVQGSENKK